MSTTSTLRLRWTIAIVAVAVMVIAQSTQAADGEPGWWVRLDFAWVDPAGDFVSTSGTGAAIESSFDTGFGGGIRGEYQFSNRFGVELGVLSVGSVDITSGILGGTVVNALEVSSFTPVTLGLNVHLTPDHRLDLYAGPLLALVSYSDVDIRATIGTANTSESVDNDFGWGAIVGVDVPLGERGWLIQANLRYIDTDIKDSGGAISFASNFDPVIFSLGFGYRF